MEVGAQELGELRWSKYTRSIDANLSPDLKIEKREELIKPSKNLFKAYLRWTWGYFARTAYRTGCSSTPNSKTCAALLSIINSKQPDVVLNVLRYVIYQLNVAIDSNDVQKVSKVGVFLSSLYRFRIISVDMMNQIIFKIIEKGEIYIRAVLDIIWQVGPALEDDDYQTFTTLFSLMETKWRSQEKEIQKISVWRQQKWTQKVKNDDGSGGFFSYSRIPFRLSILEDEAYITLSDFDVSEVTEDPTIGLTEPYDIESFLQKYEMYRNEINDIVGDDEDDFEGDDVDAEDGEAEEEEEEEEKGEEKDDSTAKAILEKTQKSLDLEYQKTVYLTISSTGTAGECAHKLAKMMKADDLIFEREKNQKKKQSIKSHRKILIETVIEYIGHSQSFERNQANVVRLLCNAFDYFTPLVEEYFTTVYVHAEAYKASQIINISSLYAYLLASETVSWNILSIIRLSPEDTNTEQRQFIRYLMEELAKGPAERASQAWLVRKLNEPSVAAATAGIFLTDTYEHADIVYQFFKIIGLEFLCEGVKKRIDELTEKPVVVEHEPIQEESAFPVESDQSESEEEIRKIQTFDSSDDSSDEKEDRRHRHHHKHRRHHHHHHHRD